MIRANSPHSCPAAAAAAVGMLFALVVVGVAILFAYRLSTRAYKYECVCV